MGVAFGSLSLVTFNARGLFKGYAYSGWDGG
jgi:hypothetical protein